MATLIDKITTLVTANLHALVDQALKSNSLAVIDQYLRQVEDQLANLEDAAATVGGEARSLRRKVEEYQLKSAELDRAVDAFLLDGNEAAAAATQSRLNGQRQLIETYQAQLARQLEEFEQLRALRARLDMRHATMKQQRAELQALLDLAKSKETVVRVIKGLDDLKGAGDSDISRLAQSIYARLDKATAATELRAASLDEQIDQMLDRTAIAAQLAERKQKLALPAPGAEIATAK
jgi:phage shock protein A